MPEDLYGAIPAPEPLTHLFYRRAERSADQILSYTKRDGRWVGTTWREARQAVEEVALGLLELGAERGTPVAILSDTRKEWGQLDLAIASIGGRTIGIYPSLTGTQARQLLELSGARIAFVDQPAQRTKLREATADLDPPLAIITLEPRADVERTITFDELRRRGAKRKLAHPDELAKRVAETKSSDVISAIYTSGTTGEPKGAMLTHANFHYAVHAINQVMHYQGETAIAFLPLAHSLQRFASYLPLVTDIEAYYAESLDKLPDNILEVRPTCFAAVPRVLEKIHAKVLARGASGSRLSRRIFDRSLAAMDHAGAARRGGKILGLGARIFAGAADRVVGAKIRDRLGGRVKFIGCGGAPLGREVHEFFENIGIPILEGWGLTETSAATCVNTLAQRRIGTVGRPLPGTEIRIAEDGEILVKGPGVFIGYQQNDQATQEAFDEEGWFKTGDVGTMSRDGFLTITDRKKDLLITAGGKNVAPQPLENALKRSAVIAQAVVIGDRRPYLTALIGVDPEMKKEIAEPQLKMELDAHLERLNSALPSFEQIKKYELLPGEMTIESGELTPTLKVKRRVVTERYASLIEKMYHP